MSFIRDPETNLVINDNQAELIAYRARINEAKQARQNETNMQEILTRLNRIEKLLPRLNRIEKLLQSIVDKL